MNQDCGPKPLIFMKCLLLNPAFFDFVEDWDAELLFSKENLNVLKNCLEKANRESFEDLQPRSKEIVGKMNELDKKDDEEELNFEEEKLERIC